MLYQFIHSFICYKKEKDCIYVGFIHSFFYCAVLIHGYVHLKRHHFALFIIPYKHKQIKR